MGRIHDALKKAEEERKKKRAEKAKNESSGSDHSQPASANHQSRASVTEEIPVVRQAPRIDEIARIPDPAVAKRRKNKGIAAGLKRATESQPPQNTHRFGELLLAYHAPTDQRSEQIRSLRTNIVNLDPTPTVLAFVSAVGDEGACVTAANLAVSFAEDKSQKILLVDANLRDSGLAGFFDVSQDAPGFTEILDGRLSPDKAVLESGVPSLFYVGAGRSVENPGALLSAQAIERVFSDWRKRFDRILIVLPPVTEANDAAVVGREVDGTVMVIKLGSTPRKETEHALEALAHSGVRVLGCVVTNASAVKDLSRTKS